MFDLDHFKSINDRFGHHVGDDVLRVFATVTRTTMRASDVIGRLGGEEFVAIVPGSLADAAAAAERVRVAFERRGVEVDGQVIAATVSIGAACGRRSANLDTLDRARRRRALPRQGQRPQSARNRRRGGRRRARAAASTGQSRTPSLSRSDCRKPCRRGEERPVCTAAKRCKRSFTMPALTSRHVAHATSPGGCGPTAWRSKPMSSAPAARLPARSRPRTNSSRPHPREARRGRLRAEAPLPPDCGRRGVGGRSARPSPLA